VFEFLGTDAMAALLQVVLIDLVLAGDNAIVIGLAAAGLPEAQRGKAILIGIVAATTSAVVDPPAAIPAEHSAKLIALGYMADLSGRLRMTTPGRQRMAAGFEDRPLLISN
jgi:hypothetical protein